MSETIDSQPDQSEKQIHGAKLRHFLFRAIALRKAANGDPNLARHRLLLREWQARRLANTHRDLLSSKHYGEVAQFFLSDLYGPKDFSERDHEMERVLPMIISFLPASGVQTVALAIELDAISEELDEAMVRALRTLGRIEAIDADAYVEAYRVCDNRPLRERQIALIAETGHALDRLTRKLFVSSAIRLMRAPAHAAGLEALHDFLERGFHAFHRMRDAETFLETVCSRETRIMDSILANEKPVSGLGVTA
ncbi:MAG: hypothetical protein WBP72_17060 [Rhodocyclaceae bacterium]